MSVLLVIHPPHLRPAYTLPPATEMTRMKCPRWTVGEATYINHSTPGIPRIKTKFSGYSCRALYPIRAFLREVEKVGNTALFNPLPAEELTIPKQNDVPTRLKGRKPTCGDSEEDLDDALAEAHWRPDPGDKYRRDEEHVSVERTAHEVCLLDIAQPARQRRRGAKRFQTIIQIMTDGDDTGSEGWDGASERWDVVSNDDSEWEEIPADEHEADEWEELYEKNLKVERAVTAARSYSAVLRGEER
ncbi:hypothetical protein C8R44DRAFT_880841 [Mycena epipterygia]|nr:hypothetical protein C8R44DRAFT_880841 [Mycena epipterygia]